MKEKYVKNLRAESSLSSPSPSYSQIQALSEKKNENPS